MGLGADSADFDAAAEIPATELVSGFSVLDPASGGASRGSMIALQDGVEVMQWTGRFDEPMQVPILDDSNRVCFSFNRCFSGGASCIFADGYHREFEAKDACGSIQYCPGRRGIYRQCGTLRNLTMMVRPDIFAVWSLDVDPELKQVLRHGDVLEGHRGGELLAATQSLVQALDQEPGDAGPSSRHPLWLQAQVMKVVGLFLEARGIGSVADPSGPNRSRLLRARDLLLADLSRPPNLPELAREAGLSSPTLTRGFRRLFGESPFNLYQRERMHVAHYRLTSGSQSITTIAADLGYSNASHFSAAFRKQFGLLPSDLRRRH